VKYLSSQPFTIAVTSGSDKRNLPPSFIETERKRNVNKAAKPHEYVNMGVMCLVCGLDEKAKIHEL
jgi:hypothetical protein